MSISFCAKDKKYLHSGSSNIIYHSDMCVLLSSVHLCYTVAMKKLLQQELQCKYVQHYNYCTK